MAPIIDQIFLGLYKMEASGYESGEDEINVNQGSLNETANSIHFQNSEKDKEMAQINKDLQMFIKQQLTAGIRFDDLPSDKMFSPYNRVLLDPIPFIYFLPHTLLIREKDPQLPEKIYEKVEYLNRKDITTIFDRDNKEVNVRVHNQSQLCSYNIRCLKSDPKLHKNPSMLDGKFLVDKLYEFYEHFYEKIYFRETTILILYWAHQKGILQHVISESALKLMVICIFISFGYGVNNIIFQESSNKQKMKEFKKMSSFARMNQRGETQIMPDLIEQFENYTIQEKRGFFIVSKKKYQLIKDIVPVYYPILPLSGREEEKYRTEAEGNIKGVLDHDKENMSICKNIYKIFHFLRNKFQKQMRFVVDFQEKLAYRHEFSQNFELEVIHPVLNTSICKLKDITIKTFKNQINFVFQEFHRNENPINVIKDMLKKTRNT